MAKNDKKYDDFIAEQSEVDLDAIEDIHTDWEGRASAYSVSPRTLKLYLRFLEISKYILMCIFALMITAIIGLAFKFLLFTKFEMIIFDDGTGLTCLFDPSTEEIKPNDK